MWKSSVLAITIGATALLPDLGMATEKLPEMTFEELSGFATLLDDSPSAFLDSAGEIGARLEEAEGITSTRGGPGGRRLTNGVGVQNMSLFLETDLSEPQLQATLKQAIRSTLEEFDASVKGESEWTPPAGVAVFYETDGRYGGIYCVLGPRSNGYRLMLIVQEGPSLRPVEDEVRAQLLRLEKEEKKQEEEDD